MLDQFALSHLGLQLLILFILAIPVACVAWTVTHEDIFREPRDYCIEKSKRAPRIAQRKFFYLFTCEYCFSHYAAAFFLLITRYKLLFNDWRGYLISFFALVWVANQYISIFGRLRLDIREAHLDIKETEVAVEQKKQELEESNKLRAA